MSNKIYHYFVEGDCEEKFINAFKTGKYAFLNAGKVEVLNPINDEISNTRVRSLKQNTIVVLVYDVDVGNIEILEKNLKSLKNWNIVKVIHIQSINNFEDEIVFSTNLNKIDDCFGTVGRENFKAKFISHKDIVNKLNKIGFDNNKMWSRLSTTNQFSKYSFFSHIKEVRR